MDMLAMQDLGLVEIGGETVFGGEMINPIVIGIAISTYTMLVGGIVANWADFKDGIFAGYNAATH